MKWHDCERFQAIFSEMVDGQDDSEISDDEIEDVLATCCECRHFLVGSLRLGSALSGLSRAPTLLKPWTINDGNFEYVGPLRNYVKRSIRALLVLCGVWSIFGAYDLFFYRGGEQLTHSGIFESRLLAAMVFGFGVGAIGISRWPSNARLLRWAFGACALLVAVATLLSNQGGLSKTWFYLIEIPMVSATLASFALVLVSGPPRRAKLTIIGSNQFLRRNRRARLIIDVARPATLVLAVALTLTLFSISRPLRQGSSLVGSSTQIINPVNVYSSTRPCERRING
ncbi:hypothetical protein [Acidithrix ferrooxidans]|nr:hypothetical protein [Acidithrix ferrooxidans]